MTTPTDPMQSGPSFPIQSSGGPQEGSSSGDPTGVWSKFLSGGGNVATPQEVKMFIQGILKMFNVLIQQQNAAAERAAQQLKKAEEGEAE
jgi:hypothetical protein